MKYRKVLVGAAAALLATVSFGTAQAQLGGLGNILKAVPASPLGNIMSGPTPVSTNIKDAVYGDPSQDRFAPPGAAKAMTSLARSPTGGFVLQPGYYRMTAQSYCLHAGTHGPSQGEGYLFGPVKGSARDAVISILQNSTRHPEIDQHRIQLLLWAIVSRTKFEDLSPDLKLVAAQLLTKKQLVSLNRSALSVLTSPELSRLTGGLPAPLRAIAQAESRIRGLMSTPGAAYADIERVAVLTGRAPLGAGSVEVPAARWSQHPDGYWVRYRPSSYTNTQVEVWVPTGSAAVGKVYDPATAIAVPGNTARQRLAQSARVYTGS